MKQLRKRRQGQALVEAVLTLPLTVFLILGSIQIFLMQQARLMADYAAMRAVRAGSTNFGNCDAMTHAAIGALLPTFAKVDSPTNLATAFAKHINNDYAGVTGSNGQQLSGDIVWIFRERPNGAAIRPDEEFDMFYVPIDEQRLEVRLVFWYPLRIPFADWVLTRMFLAQYGLQAYLDANPLMEAQTANWPGNFQTSSLSSYARPEVVAEYVNRASNGQYVYPIQSSYSMRMMTPPRAQFFNPQNCSPAPPQ